MTDTCSTPQDSSLPLEHALRAIHETIAPSSATVDRPIADALNCVLAVDVEAPISVPAHRNSAMDGYAFRRDSVSSSGEVSLHVAGQSLAGHPHLESLSSADAVQVMTGAVVPDSLDTVVVQEQVSRAEDTIRFDATDIAAGAFVRQVGDDIQFGQTVLQAGSRLGAAELGVLASLGIGTVSTRPTPRVAVLSTGDELRAAGDTLAAGQIYDSNRTTLTALLRNHHCEAVDIGQIQDSPDAIRRALDRASTQADVILSSGGVSVGVADHMRAVLESEGTLQFWKIAVKPGRPLVFGRWKGAWYFGLPGNPVSAMVTFEQIVRPSLARLEGERSQHSVHLTALCDTPLRKMPGRMEFQRGTLGNRADGQLCVRSTGNQDSHVLTSLTRADCLIALPLESSGADVDDAVTVIPMTTHWGLAPT